MITGLDLVSWQLKIAANESLPLSQREIKANGHAIECRIYAEDPFNGFIPSIGSIHYLQEPSGDGIRIDTGVTVSSQITMYYDPMIAKLISWGESRDEALQRLQQALSHYYIGGVKSNIPFLQAICQHSKFRNAELSTDFLAKESICLPGLNKDLALLMAISFDYLNAVNKINDSLCQDAFGWQMHLSSHWVWRFTIEDQVIEAKVIPVSKKQHAFPCHHHH